MRSASGTSRPRITRRRWFAVQRFESAQRRAVGWVIARINNSVTYHGAISVKDYLVWFAITGSVTTRAQVMLRAIGAPDSTAETYSGPLEIGVPELLTSFSREALCFIRDEYLADQ